MLRAARLFVPDLLLVLSAPPRLVRAGIAIGFATLFFYYIGFVVLAATAVVSLMPRRGRERASAAAR